MSVLITGVEGDLGQALVKALRLSTKRIQCHGCDMDGAGIGSAFVESFHVVPRADDPAYVGVIDNLCRSLSVDVLIPGSEPEINVLCRLGTPPRLPSGVPIVCQEADWIEMYGDKLKCMIFLCGRVDLAPFADGTDTSAVEDLIQRVGFPLVVKDRRSSGSRSLVIVSNRQDLETSLANAQSPLVQAFIDDSGGEFSIGVFSAAGATLAIAFRRTLGPGGCSWYAESSRDADILTYALKVAAETHAKGSINIQVRKSSKGVRLLEINPRFSSLVAARAVCGFRDAEWSLEQALGCLQIKRSQPFREIRFRRYVSELVDFGDGFGSIAKWDAWRVNESIK